MINDCMIKTWWIHVKLNKGNIEEAKGIIARKVIYIGDNSNLFMNKIYMLSNTCKYAQL